MAQPAKQTQQVICKGRSISGMRTKVTPLPQLESDDPELVVRGLVFAAIPATLFWVSIIFACIALH